MGLCDGNLVIRLMQSVQILDPKSYYSVKIMLTKVTIPNFWFKIPRKTQNLHTKILIFNQKMYKLC